MRFWMTRRGGLGVRILGAGALCLGLAGCYGDGFHNPYDWSMTGAPRENLASQVADKSELLRGHGAPYANGVVAAAAVDTALDQPKGDAAALQTPPKMINFTSPQN